MISPNGINIFHHRPNRLLNIRDVTFQQLHDKILRDRLDVPRISRTWVTARIFSLILSRNLTSSLNSIGGKFTHLINLTIDRKLIGHGQYLIVIQPLIQRDVSQLTIQIVFIGLQFSRVLKTHIVNSIIDLTPPNPPDAVATSLMAGDKMLWIPGLSIPRIEIVVSLSGKALLGALIKPPGTLFNPMFSFDSRYPGERWCSIICGVVSVGDPNFGACNLNGGVWTDNCARS